MSGSVTDRLALSTEDQKYQNRLKRIAKEARQKQNEKKEEERLCGPLKEKNKKLEAELKDDKETFAYGIGWRDKAIEKLKKEKDDAVLAKNEEEKKKLGELTGKCGDKVKEITDLIKAKLAREKEFRRKKADEEYKQKSNVKCHGYYCNGGRKKKYRRRKTKKMRKKRKTKRRRKTTKRRKSRNRRTKKRRKTKRRR